MKIVKKHLDDIYRCYCASSIHFEGQDHILLASEDPNVACNMYEGENFEQKSTVWTQPGGCMSIVPFPDREKEFLAVQEFYLKVSPSLSKIVWAKYENDTWTFKDLVHLPYLHRFGIFHVQGVNYLIAATIATTKKDKNDWSVPGRIYVGKLPQDPNEEVQLEILVDGLYRNHGFYQTKDHGRDVAYFGSDQGIVKVSAPNYVGGQFQVELIMEGQIGEVAVLDIDGDGEDEIMTIEAFHGDTIQLYKKNEGKYQKVWQYDHEIDFAHALVAGQLAGKKAFVCGVRRKDCELFMVTYEKGAYQVTQIDQGGPANIAIVNQKDRDIIVAANHSANEGAIYFVEKESLC